MPELSGVALVSGAGRGLGRHTAVALAAAGMRVGLLGRTRATLEDTLRACVQAGSRSVAVPTDVTKDEAVRAAVQTVERDLGPVDLLVNNAGLVDPVETTPWQADPRDWWRVVDTNVRGPYLLCRAVVGGMVERGRGRVVNVNSGMGARAVPGYSAYSVSKAALARLTDALATDLAGTGVTVFDVSPGLVRTDMTEGMPMWQGLDPGRWNDAAGMVEVVRRVAAGDLDALTGRFLHAGKDDVDALLSRAQEVVAADARTLRLRPYGPDDPLA
ncbi:MAG: SDR family NAD(P)-dependent oxidoreductase [Actinomycetes bacterium]